MLCALALSLIASQSPPDINHEELSTGPVIGQYYSPATEGKKPAFIVLHGSEGSTQFTAFTALALAREGYPSLAIQYFKGVGQPKTLEEVPLETFDRALAWLAKQPGVDANRIGLLGYSRGAEGALHYASGNRKIKSVIAISPASCVFQGFISMTEDTSKSAWTRKGKPVPFVKVGFGSGRMQDMYERSMSKPENAEGVIVVEKINGPILLISGQDDKVWPSSYFCKLIVDRLKAKKFGPLVQWEDYPDAGHVLLFPSSPERLAATKVTTAYGGTEAGVMAAWKDAWPKTLKFIKSH